MVKGIILGNIARKFGNNGFQIPKMQPELINSSVLYWDRICIPDSNHIRLNLPSGFKLLEDEKILVRKTLQTDYPDFLGVAQTGTYLNNACYLGEKKVDTLEVINSTPIKVLETLNIEEPLTEWSIYSSFSSVEYEINKKVEEGFKFELLEQLPVPTKYIPLEKLLEFKIKREPEYLKLGENLDNIYKKIISAEDTEDLKNIEINKLQKSFEELETILNESFSDVLKRSISFEISPGQMFQTAVPVFVASGSVSLTSIATLSRCFKADFAAIFNSSKIVSNHPLKYAIDVNSKLI